MDRIKAKEALDEAVGVLKELGQVYFIDQGTLLGAVRDGRFIEWDNDIDLGLFLKRYDAADLCGVLNKRGFKTVWFLSYGGRKSPQLAMDWGGVRVDFHCYERDEAKDEIWHYAYVPLLTVAKNVFPGRLFESFEAVKLGGVEYPAPSPVSEYLRLRYGAWEVPKRGWDYMKEPPCVVEVQESKVLRC